VLDRILRPIGGKVSTVAGIDVSHFQQAIDWNAAANSGVRFCFIKATEGSSIVDARFATNWQGAADAGVMRGAYHFFHPSIPVGAQVDLFVRTVQPLKVSDLPPVLDLEAPAEWTNIPAANRAGLALQWLEGVHARLGIRPLIYLSPSFANETLQNATTLASYPLWIAHKTPAQNPDIPKPWTAWTFWQYSDQGQTAGIGTLVDADRFNGTMDALQALSLSARAIQSPLLSGRKS